MHHHPIPAGRGIFDTSVGKPPVFSGGESTWGDWSFKLRSFVSVVDLQLGRMMEAAELAAHASTWIQSEPLNQDMDAQLRFLLVMLTSGPALQIIRQQPCGVQSTFASPLPGTAARERACILILGRRQRVSQIA